MSIFSVTELFLSIQGEAAWAGHPCTFIRLAGCPLRCRWCDTAYGFAAGKAMTPDEILAKVRAFDVPLVELTGGEPLAQEGVEALAAQLIAAGYRVLIETGGSKSIAQLPAGVHIIMDLKCPGSRMDAHNLWENLDYLKPTDEIKFVIADRADFDWAAAVIAKHQLERLCLLLMSPAWGLCAPKDLAGWLIDSRIKAKLNLQQHKYIWSPKARGV